VLLSKAERQRTAFNLAFQDLKRNDPKIVDRAVKSMQDLAGSQLLRK